MLPIALAEGTWIVMLVFLLALAGVIYGFYTREGSGISSHPHDAPTDAPGAQGPSDASGKDHGEGSTLDDHGTK